MLRNVSHPFRLLLILEWLFLGTAAFMEVLLPFEFSWLLVLRVISIGLFGLMRLRLPTGKIATRWLYTAAECGLIFLAVTGFSLSARSVLVLWLVLVMRSCILLGRSGQIFILGLGLLTYSTTILTKPIVRDRILATVWDWRISNVLMSGSSLIFALLLINALLAERQIREELEIRKSILMLRSNPLQGRSFTVFIQKILTDFQHNTGITPTCKIDLPTTLFLSENTVKNYVTNILSCLNVRDRTQAALLARLL